MSQPNISGFTFIKHGLTLGYPIKESIQSIEALCDEVVINVGYDDPNLEKDDGTWEYLNDNFPKGKFKFIKSHWDPELTSQGLILSVQTNIALEKCKGKYLQYIQGDEAIHEDDLKTIESSVKEMEQRPEVDGLIYNYTHFYGNVDAILQTRRIYRREVRLIRNGLGIKSHLDAQGFKHSDGRKIKAIQTPARIFHYGWARKEQVMKDKIKVMDKFYHGSEFEKKEDFEYKKIWGIKKFTGTHPEVMKEWISQNRNDLDIHSLNLDFNIKDVSLAVSDCIEKITGYRIGEYKNFILIK
ncbi:MAG: hypothetical protein HOE90_01855 [Bacteriovoracaceae bacterium]|nr:hypothetical protein [Bacteriovoracaceae bacterium]